MLKVSTEQIPCLDHRIGAEFGGGAATGWSCPNNARPAAFPGGASWKISSAGAFISPSWPVSELGVKDAWLGGPWGAVVLLPGDVPACAGSARRSFQGKIYPGGGSA